MVVVLVRRLEGRVGTGGAPLDDVTPAGAEGCGGAGVAFVGGNGPADGTGTR